MQSSGFEFFEQVIYFFAFRYKVSGANEMLPGGIAGFVQQTE
jgi:hypothetical protein